MKENWRDLGSLSHRYIPGEMALSEVATNHLLQKSITEAKLDSDDALELMETLTELSQKFSCVSDLRNVLANNPETLELEGNLTKALLTLFIDIRAAGKYN